MLAKLSIKGVKQIMYILVKYVYRWFTIHYLLFFNVLDNLPFMLLLQLIVSLQLSLVMLLILFITVVNFGDFTLNKIIFYCYHSYYYFKLLLLMLF